MGLKITFSVLYGLIMLNALAWVATHADQVEKFAHWMAGS